MHRDGRLVKPPRAPGNVLTTSAAAAGVTFAKSLLQIPLHKSFRCRQRVPRLVVEATALNPPLGIRAHHKESTRVIVLALKEVDEAGVITGEP